MSINEFDELLGQYKVLRQIKSGRDVPVGKPSRKDLWKLLVKAYETVCILNETGNSASTNGIGKRFRFYIGVHCC